MALLFSLVLGGALRSWAQRAAPAEVAIGVGHSVCLLADGSLWAWGGNDTRPLGDGSFVRLRPSPAQVGTATNWQSVSAGPTQNFAIGTDGRLWAWGNNSVSQLGYPQFFEVPRQISWLLTATRAAAVHGYALYPTSLSPG